MFSTSITSRKWNALSCTKGSSRTWKDKGCDKLRISPFSKSNRTWPSNYREAAVRDSRSPGNISSARAVVQCGRVYIHSETLKRDRRNCLTRFSLLSTTQYIDTTKGDTRSWTSRTCSTARNLLNNASFQSNATTLAIQTTTVTRELQTSQVITASCNASYKHYI